MRCIALNQLMPNLVDNDRLSVHQSGNKKWHSPETSLIYTSDRILTQCNWPKENISCSFSWYEQGIWQCQPWHTGQQITRHWLVILCHPVVQEILVKQVPSCAYKYCSFRTPPNEVRCSPRKHPWVVAFYSLCHQSHKTVPRTVTLMTLNCSCHTRFRTVDVNRLYPRWTMILLSYVTGVLIIGYSWIQTD